MLTYIFKIFFLIGVRIVGGICSLLSVANYFKKPQRCPPINNKILLHSAATLAEMIRKREITSEYVIKSYISRIKAVNPIINAVVEDRFELAINEAKYVDQMLSNTKLNAAELKERYPLLGLPFTVKESIAVEGLSHCAGKVFPEGKKAMKDAKVVKLCKEAGAIPLLVSNTPELSSNFETYNKVTGTTLNPYDTRRTPGGSSGGEAALLSSGASIIGLGSDIFGSLRLPAHYCCIWGHKPSSNVVSVEGHYPNCKNQNTWKQIFNLGPMTRFAADLPLLLDIILEKDFRDTLKLKEQVDLQKLRIFYMENDCGSILTHAIDRDILGAMRAFTAHLKSKYGCQIEKLKLHELKYSPELSFIKIFSLDDVEDLFENKGKGSFGELFRYLTCRSKSVIVPILCGIIRRITSFLPESTTLNCNKEVSQLRVKLKETLGMDGVLLYPCHPMAAHFHGEMYGKICDYSYLGIFNCLGVPVTSCPVGLNSKGLPIGIQVVAGSNNDRLTLAIAQEMENVFGGWIPPQFTDEVTPC